jgi:geranylgeranyl reductase family protein
MVEFDVIIIGGGPSGLQTAHFLSSNNLKVALFEKDSEIGKDVVCSGVISKEAFTRFDLPTDSVTGRLKEAELYSPSNRNINYSHPDESVVVVDRHIFDSSLSARAIKEGTEISLNSKVISLVGNENHVECEIKVGNEIKRYRSKVAVIATGVSFNLQESLGMGRPKKILMGIQVEIELRDIEKLKMYWGNQYSRGFFGWAIPLENGRAKIGVMTEKNPLEGLENILDQLGLKDNLHNGNYNIQRRGISFGRIKKPVSNRILAVGEAAGLVKTTTGGGIYYGLISAEIASTVISKAFNSHEFQPHVINDYEKLLNKEFSKELKFGEFFHNFYSDLTDNEINQLFDAAKKDNLLSYISENGKFDWHKEAVINILKSPNIRKILFKSLIKQGARLAFS